MPSRRETEKVLCPNGCGAIVMPRGLKSHLQSCKKFGSKSNFVRYSRYIQAFFVCVFWLHVFNLLPDFLEDPIQIIEFRIKMTYMDHTTFPNVIRKNESCKKEEEESLSEPTLSDCTNIFSANKLTQEIFSTLSN